MKNSTHPDLSVVPSDPACFQALEPNAAIEEFLLLERWLAMLCPVLEPVFAEAS